MSLATAPCTHCRTRIVYGQRRCHSCGTTFDYGPTPPPEPTPQQIQEAHMAADIAAQIQAQSGPQPVAPAARPAAAPAARPAAAPAIRPPAAAAVRPAAAVRGPMSVPSGAPVVDDDLVDRGRYDELSAAPVQTEDIPGFVDSTLFKAFTPDVVDTQQVEGLEQTSYDDTAAAVVATEYVPVEHTAQESVGAVSVEDIPGFVDSTLFKAFTPDVVESESVEGLEVSLSAAASRPRAPKKRSDDGGLKPCGDCGSPHDKSTCPACGARRKSGD